MLRGTWWVLLRIVLPAAVLLFIWYRWDADAFYRWKEEAGPVPFFAALAILPAFGVPTTPFYLLAGATFGIPIALTGSFAALACNLALCFWIARGPMRSVFEKWARRSRWRLPDLATSGAWRFTLLVKFMPAIPAFIKHYLIVLAGVPAAIYFPVSLVASGFYATGFIILGESALDRDPTTALVTLAVLGGVTALVWWIRRRRARAG